MPELPEVETVKRGLSPVLEAQILTHVAVNRADLRRPFPPNMAERLTGTRVLGLRRRAKYILIDLDSGETLLVHLGMSGRVLIDQNQPGVFAHKQPVAQKHDHVVFTCSNGARITYNDPRRFGMMDLYSTNCEDKFAPLAILGPEPLGNGFDEAYLITALAQRSGPIKTVLLDQSVVAGLGNIYVCEALFRAGIHPKRPANRISNKRIAKLVRDIRQVLVEAIEAGGSSLRDYKQTDGELGYFQHSFAVYGREDKTCQAIDCKSKIKRINQSGRSSFFCPSCQR